MLSRPLPRRRRLSRRPHGTRSGFTLLEVLLAAALCAVLVAASFEAVHLNWKYRTAGEATRLESRLRLGLVEDLAFDLRAALAPDAEGLDRAVRPAPSAGRSRVDFSEQQLTIADDIPLRPIHFVGTPSSLLVLRGTPSPRFPAPSRSTPVQQVVWWSGAAGAPRLPYATSGTQKRMRSPALPMTSPASGLLRTAWPVGTGDARPGARIGSGDGGGTIPVESSVRSIGFRYFDGSAWRTGWNSCDDGALPRAVEVTLTLMEGDGLPLRCVVHLPQGRSVAGGETALPGTRHASLDR